MLSSIFILSPIGIEKTDIYNILANEKYAGLYHHDGELFPDIYPAIVPMEIYEKVQSKMTPKSRGKRSYTTDYIFKGKITCGYCGNSVCVECGTSKQGNIKRYYKCSGRKKQNGCQKSNIQKDRLEQIILDTVIEAIGKPEVLEKLVAHLLDAQEKIASKSTRLASLTKDKREIETALDNIMKAVDMGVVNNTTQRRMNELENQLKNIEEQMLIEKAKTTQLLSADTIREYYKQAILQKPKLMSNYLIKHMTLYDDRVEITLNSPQMGIPERPQGFPLFISQKYKIQHYQIEMYATI